MPGRVMSRIRQLGPSQRPLFRSCSAVSKLSDCRLADFSRPCIDARIRGSSSTMNTMDDSVAMRNLIVNGSLTSARNEQHPVTHASSERDFCPRTLRILRKQVRIPRCLRTFQQEEIFTEQC